MDWHYQEETEGNMNRTLLLRSCQSQCAWVKRQKIQAFLSPKLDFRFWEAYLQNLGSFMTAYAYNKQFKFFGHV